MQPFVIHRGTAAVLDRLNVDTDQIIPKQFLKRIERTGFGEFLFYDWRFLESGEKNPDFELNRPEAVGASILITGANFGCGSSREHAPWALLDFGFRVLIAPSFADIFYNNAFKNGMLPICLEERTVRNLMEAVQMDPSLELELNLKGQVLNHPSFDRIPFDVDPFRKHCLINGLDDIGLTLASQERIERFEQNRSDFLRRSSL